MRGIFMLGGGGDFPTFAAFCWTSSFTTDNSSSILWSWKFNRLEVGEDKSPANKTGITKGKGIRSCGFLFVKAVNQNGFQNIYRECLYILNVNRRV